MKKRGTKTFVPKIKIGHSKIVFFFRLSRSQTKNPFSTITMYTPT